MSMGKFVIVLVGSLFVIFMIPLVQLGEDLDCIADLESSGHIVLATSSSEASRTIYTRDIIPSADSTYDLGASGTEWAEGYFDTLAAGNISDTLYSLDSGALVVGSQSLEDVAGTADDYKMIFDVSGASFRAGSTFGTNVWDTSNRGFASFAGGHDTEASGHYSTAFGAHSEASGFVSTAAGHVATASGTYSSALGHLVSATNWYTTAIGSYNTASGISSTAIGSQNTASGELSLALGSSSVASGVGAKVLGSSSEASGSAAIMIGNTGNATRGGEIAFSSGQFATPGDTQATIFTGNEQTTDATAELMEIGDGTNKLTIPVNFTVGYDVTVVGRRTDVAGEGAMYTFLFAADNNAGTSALVGAGNTTNKTVIVEDDADWDCNVVISNTFDRMNIYVTGEAGKTINWTARVEETMVGG